MKESNYKNGFQTNKKRKGKTVTTVIVLLLVTSLMLGVVGYFRTDIMDLMDPTLAPAVETPIIVDPVIDEPIIDEPVVVPVEEDDPVVIVPAPEPILLNVGDSIESIYFNTDIFDEVVKANLATLDIDNNPDYSGIGYKFLSVDLLVDDNTFEYQFVVCPFVRFFEILDIDYSQYNISELDYFVLIYCPDLTDWFFDECFYSSVTVSILIPPDDESEGVEFNFARGFRRDGFDVDGKLMFDEIVNRNVINVYGEDQVYEIGNINFIDDIVAPLFVSANDIKLSKFEIDYQSLHIYSSLDLNDINYIKNIFNNTPSNDLITFQFLNSHSDWCIEGVSENAYYRSIQLRNYNAIGIASYEYYNSYLDEILEDFIYIMKLSDYIEMKCANFVAGVLQDNDAFLYDAYFWDGFGGNGIFDKDNIGGIEDFDDNSYIVCSHNFSLPSDSYYVLRRSSGSLLDYASIYRLSGLYPGEYKIGLETDLVEIIGITEYYNQNLFDLIFTVR